MALRSNIVLTVAILAICSGCSQYSTSRPSVAFHNLTAKYNAYVIARDQMILAEKTLEDNHKYDYNVLMPILQPMDSVEARSVSTLLDDVIKKASLVPSRHQNSKWVDNALVLLGKARLYQGQFTEAIETFRYVNAQSSDDNDQHHGLIWLMRAYTETKDYNNALAVAEYLRSQPLNKTNTRDFYLVKAYLHQQKNEYRLAVGILEETFGLMPRNEAKARAHFAAAQMYDLLGNTQKSAEEFVEVSANRPSYDMDFFARMSAVQNQALSDARVSTESGFKKLLNDRKNSDLRDRLYYTMGMIENRKKNYNKAIDYFKTSIQNTTTNTTQVPYTYLEMARVYYDKLQNFEQAKAYYDSSLALLPKTSPDFQKVTDRKVILDEFVKHLTVVRTEDSLQRLSQLSPTALDKYLDGLIEKQIDDEKKQLAEAQKLVDAARANIVNAGLDGPTEDRFVLYDLSAMAQGKTEFKQRWGNRPLEDNWRRGNKSASTLTANDPNIVAIAPTPKTPEKTSNTLEKGSPQWQVRKSELARNIPTKMPEILASNAKVEEALYKLGKIYKLNLEENTNAVKAFEELLGRFPGSKHKAEAYYFLYLANEKPATKESWKARLLREVPSSSFARLIMSENTQPQTGGNMESQALQEYEKLFGYYQSNNYTEALAQLETAQFTYASSRIADKFALLKIFLVGKIQGKEAYIKSLNDFVRDFAASPMLPRVREMLDAQQTKTN
jgi:tetratricopeptide (TPR) repeat protein